MPLMRRGNETAYVPDDQVAHYRALGATLAFDPQSRGGPPSESAGRKVAEMAVNAIPAAGTVIGGVVGAAGGPAGIGLGGGLGAAGGEAIRELVARAAGMPAPESAGQAIGQIAGSGALGAASSYFPAKGAQMVGEMLSEAGAPALLRRLGAVLMRRGQGPVGEATEAVGDVKRLAQATAKRGGAAPSSSGSVAEGLPEPKWRGQEMTPTQWRRAAQATARRAPAARAPISAASPAAGPGTATLGDQAATSASYAERGMASGPPEVAPAEPPAPQVKPKAVEKGSAEWRAKARKSQAMRGASGPELARRSAARATAAGVPEADLPDATAGMADMLQKSADFEAEMAHRGLSASERSIARRLFRMGVHPFAEGGIK